MIVLIKILDSLVYAMLAIERRTQRVKGFLFGGRP